MVKRAAKQDSDARTAPEIAADIFRNSLKHISDEIAGLSTGDIKPPKEYDTVSRIAWLAKNAAQVAAEQRKAEKGELNTLKRLTPAQVLVWIREQTPEYRARLTRDIAAIDNVARRSVLG